MFGLFKFLRRSYHMRLFVFDALESCEIIPKGVAIAIMRQSLIWAKQSDEWKHPPFDAKSQCYLWLLTGIETTIRLGLAADNSFENRNQANRFKQFYFQVMTCANTKPYLKVNPVVVQIAKLSFDNLTW